MSELRFETYTMPAGRLGHANPLPPLRRLKSVHGSINVHESVPEHARTYLGYGLDTGLLPYTLQDNYGRQREGRAFRVAVLENEHLRAVFLLELGGRLGSLVHKASGYELLYRNPVFQPGNLAIRNAWFSGGVEWNCSIQGHTPFTCSPLFAARLKSPEGFPVLRMYEWERIRGVPYQLDCFLPGGSQSLYVAVRIVNPHDAEIPMYWWSNIAVKEAPDVRVIVPTDFTYNFGYEGIMRRIPVPVFDGVDRTYATNLPTAADAFYDLPEGVRPWIAALDGQGKGLIHTSTARLKGRKLFVWGMNPGGRHWQEFLSQPGHPYMEIQAGLAQTQIECIPMPGRAEWSWLEAYSMMEADPSVAHGSDWQAARMHVADRLEALVPEEKVTARYEEWRAMFGQSCGDVVQPGAGWGALEKKRAERTGGKVGWDSGFGFTETSFTDEQTPWLALLEGGEFPYREPGSEPGAWMVQAEWRTLLESALADGKGAHWLSWLHLGVMRYHAGERDAACEAWERSLACEPSAWALRNLAVLAQEDGDAERAAALWLDAHRLLPDQAPIATECVAALLTANRPEDVLALYENAPDNVRGNTRVQIGKARADLATGRLDAVEQFLMHAVDVADIREGEVTLSDLWYALQERRVSQRENIPIDDNLKQRVRSEFPPPKHLDFRMTK